MTSTISSCSSAVTAKAGTTQLKRKFFYAPPPDHGSSISAANTNALPLATTERQHGTATGLSLTGMALPHGRMLR